PVSIRFASSTSRAGVSSGTAPIWRRYTRTESSMPPTDVSSITAMSPRRSHRKQCAKRHRRAKWPSATLWNFYAWEIMTACRHCQCQAGAEPFDVGVNLGVEVSVGGLMKAARFWPLIALAVIALPATALADARDYPGR